MSRTVVRAWCVVVAVVSLAVVMFAGTPAMAASAAPAGRPTFSQGLAPAVPGVEWGVTPTQLGACVPGADENVGGWTGRTQVSLRHAAGSGQEFRPALIRMGEPCSTGSTVNTIRIPLGWFALPVAGNPVQVRWAMPLSAEVVPGTTSTAAIKCATSEWSATGAWRNLTTVSGDNMAGPNMSLPGNEGAYASPMSIATTPTTSCSHIQMIRIILCGYFWDETRSSTGVQRCDVMVWGAGSWFRGQPYTEYSEGVTLCKAGADSAECVSLVPPDTITWDSVCGPGFPDWASPAPGGDVLTAYWSELAAYTWEQGNALIEHLARCLFVPPGGFDRHGTAAAAWNESAMVEAATAAGAVATSFMFTGGCGPIISFSGVWPGAGSIDTCAWSSWAEPAKLAIGFGLAIPFALWIVVFILETLRGLLGPKAIPLTPMEKGFKP